MTLHTATKRGAKVFINYRREDASGYAGRLYEWLCDRFGAERVFMDVSAIRPGEDFVRAIESEISACEAVLVIIGRQWLSCEAGGRRRLEDPHDFVRIEIAAALRRDTLVIPVLVEGASVPREQDLPEELKPLARRHALEITDERWEYDAGRLIDILGERLEKRRGAPFPRVRAKRFGRGEFGPAGLLRPPPVRLLVGLLLLSAALASQLLLLHRPEPVRLEETGRFSPAEVRLGRERLTVEEPGVDTAGGLILAHVANPEEIVNLGFERARLDGDTLMQFGDYNPPTTPARVEYRTAKPGAGAKGEPCRTFVNVRAADALKKPSALRFFQSGAPGGDVLRTVDLEAEGAGLLVNVVTDVPDEGDERAPGCAKLLKVEPGFESPVNGVSAVSVVAEPDSVTHFSFNPAAPKNELWQGADGLFEPFSLGGESPAPFRARALKITSQAGDGDEALLEARCAEGEWLNVESLSVGSDRLQVRVSGVGFLKVHGEDYLDLPGRVRKHPLAAILFAALDASLLVWLLRTLFTPRRDPAR